MDIDIVCPMYKNINQILYFCQRLSTQKNVNIKNLVCPHTLCNDQAIDERISEILKENNAITFQISKDSFSHSLTREKAVKEYCTSKIVIFMSQDVKLTSEDTLYNLAKELDDGIIYVYGRQICNNKSIEKYIRKKNYGDVSFVVDKSMVDKLQLMAFFASDAFSAIDRDRFLELNGYQGFDVMMNEDQLYSKFVLDAGFKKKYVSNAIVEHSHKYKLKQLYKRYYEAGKFYNKVEIFNGYKSTDSGFKLALYVLVQALKHFDIPVLFRWLPDMTARYFGMKKGIKEKK